MPTGGSLEEALSYQRGAPVAHGGALWKSDDFEKGFGCWLRQEGRYKAIWKREFKLPWRRAGLLKSSQ